MMKSVGVEFKVRNVDGVRDKMERKNEWYVMIDI